ncbi:MAG: hypothetical protein IJY99_01895 [Alphaproteobacteria bacterium]|nr:hypothetical protein [Alphaproteobacteria bacterium]
MRKHLLFLISAVLLTSGAHAASKCSHANLTRCLDSACAINLSTNPAARCQYCGTSSAGEPVKSKMRSVSAGASAKYNISEKDLKKAPTDPGKRYAWATEQCIKKIAGCTPDDVSEAYDSLIEQSCTAAGVSAKMAAAQEKVGKKKTQTSCKTDIRACVVAQNRCTSDFRACEADADFDKFFSACGVEVSGCDEYISAIRSELISDRNNAIKNADVILAQIAESYAKARDQKLATTKNSCKNNSGYTSCVETVCANNMPNKCGDGFQGEKTMAGQLCRFHEIACATID